jgi:hypothetical protein
MALAEITQTDPGLESEQIARVRDKLAEHGIARLAVLGPPDSPGVELASQIGVAEVQIHDSYDSVLAASRERGVGSVLPCHTVEGPETKTTSNLSAILKAGRAMLTCVDQTIGESVVHTKIVIAA